MWQLWHTTGLHRAVCGGMFLSWGESRYEWSVYRSYHLLWYLILKLIVHTTTVVDILCTHSTATLYLQFCTIHVELLFSTFLHCLVVPECNRCRYGEACTVVTYDDDFHYVTCKGPTGGSWWLYLIISIYHYTFCSALLLWRCLSLPHQFSLPHTQHYWLQLLPRVLLCSEWRLFRWRSLLHWKNRWGM